MIVIAIGEVLVIVLLRPLRWLLGGKRTLIGRAILRIEEWLLRQMHVMGAEARMRYELEMRGDVSAALSYGGVNEQSTLVGSTSDTVDRARRDTGAHIEDRARAARLQGSGSVSRGPRRVDSSGGDRTNDIHHALLEAQRRQRAEEERYRRRQPRS